jgi:hypothetical protein
MTAAARSDKESRRNLTGEFCAAYQITYASPHTEEVVSPVLSGFHRFIIRRGVRA